MDVLDKAELHDGYRSRCRANRLNAAARQGQEYELDAATPAATLCIQSIRDTVPLVEGCEFAVLHATADGGMPHTRAPNLICLPTGTLPKGSQPTPTFCETIAHEGIHIHQRKYPAEWRALLRKKGWEPVATEAIPEDLRAQARLNPDTMAAPYWAWKGAHVPIPCLIEGGGLNDIRTRWLDLRTGAILHTPPKSFPGPGHSYDHPFEEYAYAFQTSARSLADLNELLASK